MGRLLEKWVAWDDLLTTGAYADQSSPDSDELFDPLDIVAAGLR